MAYINIMFLYTYLVPKSDTSTEADPSRDQDDEVVGGGAQNRPYDEENRRGLNRDFPSKLLASDGSHEGSDDGGEVKRGREELQKLVVVFAVVVLFCMVLLSIDFWEKLRQEVIH